MKKPYLITLFSAIIILSFLSVSYASTYTGEYMFTMDGNDSNTPITVIETEIETWFSSVKQIPRDIELDFYSKINAPDASDSFITITYYDDNLSGTWSTINPIEFYSVKGGTQFAFYWIDGGSNSGTWSTEHILNNGGNIPEISHLSSWNPIESVPPATQNPEPNTLLLLGLGLIGVAGIGRKKK